MKKKVVSILLVVVILLVLFPTLVSAEGSPDITDECELIVSSNTGDADHLSDGKLSRIWTSASTGYQSITIKVPDEVEDLQGFYIRWADDPIAWEMTIPMLYSNPTIISNENPEFYAEWISIPSGFKNQKVFTFRVYSESKISISEISIYNGEVPYFVPQWESYDGQPIDILLIVCHSDDEALYFAPWIAYARERGLNIVVVFMTASNTTRRIEAQESVWTLGGRIYPVLRMPNYGYSGPSTKATRITGWSEDESLEFIIEQIRKYKPSIVVSHDIDGEYGHGSHKLTSSIVREAVTISGDPNEYPESAEEYNVWTADELYIHLYNRIKIYFDIEKKLTWCEGLTTHELSEMAFSRHKSQQSGRHTVYKDGIRGWPMAEFGLYWINPELLEVNSILNSD